MIAIVEIEIVDDGRVVENGDGGGCLHAKTVGMRVAKISCGHKCKKVHTDAKIKTGADNRAVENDSNAGTKNAARRQRRPTAIII